MANASSPFSLIQFRGLGGAMARVDSAETAFAHRDTGVLPGDHRGLARPQRGRGRCTPPGPGRSGRRSAAKAPASTSTSSKTRARSASREAYPPLTYARLAKIKRHYDPENLFRFNQNVTPRAGSVEGGWIEDSPLPPAGAKRDAAEQLAGASPTA